MLVSVNNIEEATKAASNLRLEVNSIQEISKFEFMGYGRWPSFRPLNIQTTIQELVSAN